MSDHKWDDLFDELVILEKDTGLIFSNSPTRNVGYEVKSNLSKVEHSIPLKSLGKKKEISEVQKFIGEEEVLLMLKGDGLTIELIYNDGLLVQGSTRGNSVEGEDITHNCKVLKNIPLKINFKGYLKLAGEAIILEKDLQEINKTLDKDSNSRNLVAGSVRQLNSEICAKRNVIFLGFTLIECKENNNVRGFITVEEQFNFLKELGFSIIQYTVVNYNDEDFIKANINCLREFAFEKGIPIDGIVIKYNNIAYGLALGETEHHPNNAIAFKFYNENFETKYIRTEWQVSRTGMINPVAIFESINLDGAITSRATLHNIDYFKNLQLGKGDIINVARMNQVIPKVIDNKTRSNTEVIPEICPVCSSKTKIVKLKTAQILTCTNEQCPSKKVAAIEHYCSRDAMNIVGLSEATIIKFIDKGFIKEISCLYNLEKYKDKIVVIEGFGLKSYNNLINSINNSKKCKLSNFLYALGIPNVGKKTSKDLANHFKNIDEFTAALNRGYNLAVIEDIGEITNNEIHLWWHNSNNRIELEELLEYVKIKEFKQQMPQMVEDNPLKGKRVYPTGKFSLKKAELKIKLEEVGAIVESGYKKSLDLLICGNDTSKSGKVQMAIDDNIKLMTEEDMMKVIEK